VCAAKPLELPGTSTASRIISRSFRAAFQFMCHVAPGTTGTAFSQKFQAIEKLSHLQRALR